MGKASQGWPQHLANYQRAAYAAVADNRGTVDGADFESVLAEGRRLREAYYSQRMESLDSGRIAVPAVAQALRRSPNGLTELEIVDIVTPLLRRADMSYREFNAAAMKAGVLRRTTDGLLRMEIPSFREWAAAQSASPARNSRQTSHLAEKEAPP